MTRFNDRGGTVSKPMVNLLFVLLTVQTAYSSSPKMDSLMDLLSATTDPQVEMSIHNVIFKLYQQEGLADDTTLIKLLNRQAFLHWRTNVAKLDSLARTALAKAQKIGYPYGVADAQYMIGFYYDLTGSYDQALDYYFTALEAMKTLGKPSKVATITEYIGIVYRYSGDYNASLKYYLEALSLYKLLKDSSRIGNALNSLGNLYFDQSDFDRAQDYYVRALALKRRFSTPNSIANTLGNISAIKRKSGELEEALAMAREVVAIKMEANNIRDLAAAYVSLSNIYEDLGELNQADSLMEMAVIIDRQVNNKPALTGDLRQLARLKRAYGDIARAKALLREAENLALEIGTLNNLRSIYQERIMIDTAAGNYKQAFRDLLRIIPINDTLSNEELAGKMARLEAAYEFDQERDSMTFANEKERVLLQSELELQKRNTYAFIGGLVLVTALALVSWMLYREKTTANNQLTQLNAAINKQKEELEQVNRTKDRLLSVVAHDLRNPLASLQGVVSLLDPRILSQEDLQRTREELIGRLNGIGDVMENLLHWARGQMGGEVVQAQSFDLGHLTDEIVRLYGPTSEKKDIGLTNRVNPGSLVFADINHIRLVLQNLVGNAIKFTPAHGAITVSAERQKDGPMVVQVQDSGIGLDADSIKDLFSLSTRSTSGTAGERGVGLGLVLVKEYIQKNQGKVWVESQKDKGTSFYFTLPVGQAEQVEPVALKEGE